MRRSAAAWLLLLALGTPVRASARQHDAPVRYEGDFASAAFHRDRREAVMRALPQNAVAVVFGAPVRNRSNDVDYEYRQSSDFLYLTGDEEPGSVLLLVPAGALVDGRSVREVLFVPPRDAGEEVWTGRRFGAERAMEELGVALAVDATRFDEILVPLLRSGAHQIFHLTLPDGISSDSELDAQVRTFLSYARPIRLPELDTSSAILSAALSVNSQDVFARLKGMAFYPDSFRDDTLKAWAGALDSSKTYAEWASKRTELLRGRSEGTLLRSVLDGLRAVKTDEEIALMQRAIDITTDAHRAIMAQAQPGWAEYEIEALAEYTFKREGSEYPGFPSIVGSGENSVILHYESNRRITQPGDVVVIDIGAEYHGYSADVTRTIPVSGHYSPEQRTIYELVYAAQEAGIEAARAGNGLYDPHQAAARVLSEGLAKLGLIGSPTDAMGLHRFFMHGTSHYLGLDVHDVGSGGPMTPGTVITVEPGLYIPAADDIDPKWWNIGVRIEDDVLVTSGEPVLLSKGAPRQIDEVEAMMRSRPVSQ
jgi:Xaa-Pro aminopeptidase